MSIKLDEVGTMKIGIIGGGSIGLLFAFYLNQVHDVVLYVRTQQQKENLETNGLLMQKGDVSSRTILKTKVISKWEGANEDLTIICVKQYQLKDLIHSVSFAQSPRLLFLQNGMGHLKWLEGLKAKNIYVGTVEHGAYRLSNYTVSHTGSGKTNLAVYKGVHDEAFFSEFTEPLKGNFPFVIEGDYKEMLTRKFIVNCVINPLTAALKVPNGELLSNTYYLQIFNRLFKEISVILQIENDDAYYENLVGVCKSTALNRSSMLKDLEENRPTEIDAILGYLLEEARSKKMEAPLVHTFYHLIKGSEIQGEVN